MPNIGYSMSGICVTCVTMARGGVYEEGRRHYWEGHGDVESMIIAGLTGIILLLLGVGSMLVKSL